MKNVFQVVDMMQLLNKINLEKFDYPLPDELIAYFPLQNRDESRLLVVNPKTNEIEHKIFKDIVDYIPQNSLLIYNNTKVIPARILFQKKTGANIEIFCLNPQKPFTDIQLCLNSSSPSTWQTLIKGKRNKPKDRFSTKLNDEIVLNATIIEKNGKEAVVEFDWLPQELTFSDILNEIGKVPLPPYIKREPNKDDSAAYQTIYAKYKGSVAAPTAGFHFSENVLNKLKNNNVDIQELTLHIGLGTFMPIESSIENHTMHFEKVSVKLETINSIIKQSKAGNGNIIAVGTTSCRTLESLYWFAFKIYHHIEFDENIWVTQWQPYKLPEKYETPDTVEILENLIEWMRKNNLSKIEGETQLFIVPGYKFRIINKLITNFHQPKSTLILLVAAFLGEELWENAYKQAIEQRYRFLSYGDSSILL